MRLLLAAPAMSQAMGGGDRYVLSLAGALAAAGDEVTAVTSLATSEADFWAGRPGSPRVDQPQPNLTIVRLPMGAMPGGRAALMAWRRLMVLLTALPGLGPDLGPRLASRMPALDGLRATLARLAPGHDLVHGFNLSWENPLLAAQAVARSAALPFIATPFAHLNDNRASRNLTMPHQLSLLRAAAGIQALSSAEKSNLVTQGLSNEQIDVVGSGFDPPPPIATVAAAVPKPFALFLGRTSAAKGAVQAADAIALLCGQGTNLHLAVAGTLLPEFRRHLDRLPKNARDRIHTLGRVDEGRKQALLREASMLLLPSRADAFGIVILEAWAHRKAVIAARSGGIPGVITDGQTGLLTPPGDVRALAAAIQRVSAEPDFAAALGQQGYERLQAHYTWSQVAGRVRQAYARVLGSASQP